MIACTSRQLVLTCNKVIVAIANKLAIIAWAVLFRGVDYSPQQWRQHRDRQGQITHQDLLGKEQDERTVERRAGNPVAKNGSS